MSNCMDCGIPIPGYPECVGGVGFVSPLSDELPGSIKQAMAEGYLGIMGVEHQVCIHCFCDAYEKVYPGITCYLREKADFIKEDPKRAARLGLITIYDPNGV